MTSSSNKKNSESSFPKIIGLIGASSIAYKHKNFLSSLTPSSDFVFLSQYEEPRLDEKNKSIYVNSIESFMDFSPKWIIVSSAASNHHKYIDTIASKAELIFIEKPLAATSLQAKDILKSEDKNNCEIVVGYNLRFLEGLSVLKNLLAKNFIGKLHNFQITVGQDLQKWRPKRNINSTVSSKKSMGGGVIRELSHEIDLAQMLFGQPQKSSMISNTSKYKQFDVEDTAFIHSIFKSSDVSDEPIIGSINMDFVRLDVKREIVVVGETGTLFYDLIKGKITLNNGHFEEIICNIDNDIKLSYERMWHAFSQKKFSDFCSVSEAYNTLLFIEKLEQQNNQNTNFG